jgi:signal transduction histidine kinase
MALENARLYKQAQELAMLEERQRLARDLHDSVSQTLFSASLAAEVLPRLWVQHPEEGQRCLDELRQLTRGALAEMRTLLVELRPASLLKAKLDDLLRQLAEAITSRARVPITVEANGHHPLPPDVQAALYRIAQEALNNIAKHARATHAFARLRYFPVENESGVGVELSVQDNGRGFQTRDVTSDHLGLGIMRERAEGVGASFTLASDEDGTGTLVRVIWPALPMAA